LPKKYGNRDLTSGVALEFEIFRNFRWTIHKLRRMFAPSLRAKPKKHSAHNPMNATKRITQIVLKDPFLQVHRLAPSIFNGMTQKQIAKACRERGVPIAKLKFDAAERLADAVIMKSEPIKIVIG